MLSCYLRVPGCGEPTKSRGGKGKSQGAEEFHRVGFGTFHLKFTMCFPGWRFERQKQGGRCLRHQDETAKLAP